MLFFISLFFCRKIQILCSVWFSLTLLMASFCWQKLETLHYSYATHHGDSLFYSLALSFLLSCGGQFSTRECNILFVCSFSIKNADELHTRCKALRPIWVSTDTSAACHKMFCFECSKETGQIYTRIQVCILNLLIIGSRSYFSIYSYLKVTQKVHGLH